MPAEWLNQSSALSARVSAGISGAISTLAQPEHLRRLRRALLCLLALWAVLALARLVWALVPVSEPALSPPANVINPLAVAPGGAAAASVDLDRMVGWHLFGKAGATAPAAAAAPQAATSASARAGIEQGARESRLQLKLRGIVASTEDGLGYAVIENNNQQAVYAVEDKLPAPGKVILAKVMPRQVVINNGGTYERLVLYEESTLGAPAAGQPAPAGTPAVSPGSGTQIDKRADPQATALAQSYRERLYQDPMSLASVVNISAAREGATLLGFKVNPGQDREQFEQLGFKPGDLVTSVNGISLDNPANTMQLFNAMRTAGEAVFELQREGRSITLSVNLGSSTAP